MPILDYLTFLQATRFATGSQTEVIKGFRLACFNVFAKNFDDHSGNFSFLYREDRGGYVLSPAYDLTRTPDMREHHMTCMGNPLPGEKELFTLASRMDIPKAHAGEIIASVEDTVREELQEWLVRCGGSLPRRRHGKLPDLLDIVTGRSGAFGDVRHVGHARYHHDGADDPKG